MRALITGILFCLAATSGVGRAQSAVPDFSKSILLMGEIGANALGIADKIEQASRTEDRNINIIINSPGGSVELGVSIISAIEIAKARGKTVTCIVTSQAASMAFYTLAHCTTRYALTYSFLLFHEPFASNIPRMTGRDAAAFSEEILATQMELDNYTFNQMGGDRKDWDKASQTQREWMAPVLARAYPKFNLILVNNAILPDKVSIFLDPKPPAVNPGLLPFLFPGLHRN